MKQTINSKKLFDSNTRWFKYDRDDLCVNKSQFVPVIFEPPCTFIPINSRNMYRQDRIACMINIFKYKYPKILNIFCTHKYDNKLSKYSDLLSKGYNIHT
jgi:hypothetical protein